jgi:hypothetical protein
VPTGIYTLIIGGKAQPGIAVSEGETTAVAR